MKCTGIVRRIDDLGRVIIPRKIRNTMGIKEGDPLEIFTDNEGGVIFKKYKLEGVCLLCNETTENEVNEKLICKKCQQDVVNDSKSKNKALRNSADESTRNHI